jgi:S-adenosylhomocysteine hydrolase
MTIKLGVEVGAPQGATDPVQGEAGTPVVSKPKTEKKERADVYGSEGRPKTEVPTSRGATPASKLGGSVAVARMLLVADKASISAGLDKDRARALEDRELAKRVGLLLQTSPYGAPVQVILSRLSEDSELKAKVPNLTYEELERLHTRFPEIVPPPNNPVDMGAAFKLTDEGTIDLYVSMFVRANGRAPFLAKAYPQTKASASTRGYFEHRYSPGDSGILQEANFGMNMPSDISRVVERTNRLAEGLTRSELFLRRVISNAPATWGPEEIAGEFNRYLEYYGALLWAGDKDTIDEAKKRATMTADRVREVMAKNPLASGAQAHAERRRALHEEIASALKSATPKDNLYSVLSGVCDRLAEKAKPKPHDYSPNAYQHAIFPRPPGPEAALLPEDLLAYISGDPSLASELDRVIGDRHEGYDKKLAERIAKTFGSRLGRTSISEIVRTMQKIDPVYNEALVQHLISGFPKIFGNARIETGKVEVNFLLAKQVAEAMESMFTGASLEDVAGFLRTKPQFAEVFPDFTADDVRLLQAAYPFLPQWDKKPEGSVFRSQDRVSLDSLVTFATRQLGANDAQKLKELIFDSLTKNPDQDRVPPQLEEAVQRFFVRGMLKTLSEAVEVTPERLSMANNKGNAAEMQRAFRERELFEYFLMLDPKAERVDREGLMPILTDKNLLGLPEHRASQVANALIKARDGDLMGAQEAAAEMLVGNPKAELYLERMTNQVLGLESLLSRIERDVFANRDLRASFKRSARIPLRLPMIQTVVEKYKDQQPLKETNVLMVQHMLGQAYPQISGYKQLGMDPKDGIFVGIPYHKNEEVEEAVAKSFGMDVRVPPRDMDELYRAIEKGVDDVMAKHFENGQKVLIVCDGPYAREYFEKKYLAKDPSLAGKVRFTEQTAFGDRPEYRNNKSMRVVSYARTELKRREAKFIGQAVVRAINAVLAQLATDYQKKPVLVLGNGPIGQAVSEVLKGDQAQVYIYDPNITAEQEAEAKRLGYTVLKDKSQIANGKFMLVGCSGYLSIGEEQILSSDPNAIYVSASSKLVEINMKRLREMATDEEGRVRRVLAAEVNDQQTWHYWLKDGTIRTVIADGLPANFNDINSVSPEYIDMTMSMSLAAAVEAVTGQELGFVGLNSGDASMLNETFDQMIERLEHEAKSLAEAEAKITEAAAREVP